MQNSWLVNAGSLSARRAWIEIVESGELVKQFDVALRKESVDRNFNVIVNAVKYIAVALRKESVDRNICIIHVMQNSWLSLSARRAWIEIFALFMSCKIVGSLSARRAWIEIPLSTEKSSLNRGRSPQGERG